VVRGRLPTVWTELARAYGPFGIVFVDPPYDSVDLPQLAEQLIVSQEGVTQEGILTRSRGSARVVSTFITLVPASKRKANDHVEN